MAVVITKKNVTESKADYIGKVWAYAYSEDMNNASDLIEYTVGDEGLNQIYNIVAEESPIECIDYEFIDNQIPLVAKWIEDNASDIREALEVSGNYDDSEKDEVDEGEVDEGESSKSSTDTLTSLIVDVARLIDKEINAKSDVEKAEVVNGTQDLINKLKAFLA